MYWRNDITISKEAELSVVETMTRAGDARLSAKL